MRYVLIGNLDKRYENFLKACDEKGISLQYYHIEDLYLLEKLQADDVIKIDPIKSNSASLKDLSLTIESHLRILKDLSKLTQVSFLNHPMDIYATLDKRKCKQYLQTKGLPITPVLDFIGDDFNDLIDYLCKNKLSQVFLKPNFGSGAAGLVALRYNRRTGDVLAYTALAKAEEYVNTKKIRRLSNKAEIQDLVNFILSMDCILEPWFPKDTVNGISYDLRVVFQFGKIHFIQARGAKNSPITNLHLNNLPLELLDFGLSPELSDHIETLCQQASECFSGLNSIGFDILVEKNSKKPYIIEMNGQGDLMYKDIFANNMIYKKQVEMMVNKWQEQ